jgi:hypothetical protein
MILPHRMTQRPRITIGQILTSVAVSALPIAIIMRSLRDTKSIVELLVAAAFCVVATFLFEVFFWGVFVRLIPALDRALGRPAWFIWELEVDPEGIDWVHDPALAQPHPLDRAEPGGDEIRWLE